MSWYDTNHTKLWQCDENCSSRCKKSIVVGFFYYTKVHILKRWWRSFLQLCFSLCKLTCYTSLENNLAARGKSWHENANVILFFVLWAFNIQHADPSQKTQFLWHMQNVLYLQQRGRGILCGPHSAFLIFPLCKGERTTWFRGRPWIRKNLQAFTGKKAIKHNTHMTQSKWIFSSLCSAPLCSTCSSQSLPLL